MLTVIGAAVYCFGAVALGHLLRRTARHYRLPRPETSRQFHVPGQSDREIIIRLIERSR